MLVTNAEGDGFVTVGWKTNSMSVNKKNNLECICSS